LEKNKIQLIEGGRGKCYCKHILYLEYDCMSEVPTALIGTEVPLLYLTRYVPMRLSKPTDRYAVIGPALDKDWNQGVGR
jgi:hypothetical protein